MSSFASTVPLNACFNKSASIFPNDHLMLRKPKPLVIGHRGNPMYYQENTLDGFTSLFRRGTADGFEVDVFLTKDNKLVCFHDENALVGKQMHREPTLRKGNKQGNTSNILGHRETIYHAAL